MLNTKLLEKHFDTLYLDLSTIGSRLILGLQIIVNSNAERWTLDTSYIRAKTAVSCHGGNGRAGV